MGDGRGLRQNWRTFLLSRNNDSHVSISVPLRYVLEREKKKRIIRTGLISSCSGQNVFSLLFQI